MKKLDLAIIGCGGLGSLFASKLAPYVNLAMIGHWPAQLAALRQGLHRIDSNGNEHTTIIQVSNDPQSIHPVDVALILVKSHQTNRAAYEAQQCLKKDGVALTLQNGLGNQDALTAVLGKKRVMVGTTSEGASIVKPGTVRHAGSGHTILAQTHPYAVLLVALFAKSGFHTTLSDNVTSLIWGKLAINAGINPLTALWDVPNRFLAENDAARALMLAAANETAVVAASHGIPLPYPNAGEAALQVAQATATNISSMLQDSRRGALTEIEAICGEIVAYGQKTGVPTPINGRLYELIKGKEENKLTIPDPLSLAKELLV